MRSPSCLCSANWPLLIGICIIMPTLLTRCVAAITTAKTNIASGTAAVTNYHNNRNYEDAATAAAAAAAVTAAMTAAATAKDYSQQLPRYYQAPTAVAARDVGGADMAATSIYRNYFENSSEGSDKNGAATVITPDPMAQWRSAAGKRHAALATDEAAMTAAGFVPTTMTAAGQHYVTSLNAAVSDAHGGGDFPANGGEKAGREEPDANADGVDSYAYAAPEGKIDYEINEDNYANGDAGVGGDGGGVGDGVKLRADDAYEMYRYDMGDYAEHMQQALAAGAANMEGQQYEATADVDSSNQGGGSYFEERLPGYENYLVPTYQIEQFSNYHNQEEQQGPHGQEALQVAQQPKSDGQGHEHGREQPQLRPLALFESSDDVDKAVLQQFNKVANIGNYENDKRKLRYYTEQPQLQQEQQQQQQQQQLQAQYQHQQQQQQLQLSHQLRKIPDFMHFSLRQHLPRLQQHPAKAMRPIDKVPLSALRRQQQQLRHHRRDTTYLPPLQVIGNAGRLSLLPTSKNLHISSDISSSGSNHNNGEPNNGSIHSRSGNNKRIIRENVDDTSNAPSLYHYALTQAHANFYPRHVSRLVDDSVNEIDDTHNNIDDNGSDSSNDGTNRRGHHQHHHLNHLHHDYASVSHHQPSVPYQQQVGTSHYALPPIKSTVRHTPASSAALAGVPLARHIEVTKHIPTIADYERIQVPYNQTIPIPIPKPIVTAIPRPYAIRVPVTKTVAVPKVQEVRIPVEKVKPFPVERPVPFVVERRVPFMVEKQVAKPVYYPYPVQVPIVKTIVHKVPRRQHSYATYQPHANSYSLPLSQYHVQHQHSGTHALPALHYTQAGHLG